MIDPRPPDELLAIDRDHVWHPYSSSLDPVTTRLVESASGVRLRLREADGSTREVVDGMASWWCAIHGYAVPELDAAARDQLASMSHVMFGGLTHAPAIGLVERLLAITPAHLTRVFLADSGSVSVEVAMKMALQAGVVDGRPTRTRFLTVRGGYHGDTFSPMSVTDPVGGMHSLFRGVLPEHVFAPLPPHAPVDPVTGVPVSDPGALATWRESVDALFAQHGPDLAAVIVEPLLQGAGGMRPWAPQAVDHLSRRAREHGALVIHDEIATGFWRTGTRWAGDRCAEPADIVCIGKAITGGYLSLAAVLCTDEVADRVSASAGALMHGPTFMGNPLACAIASASIDLLESPGYGGTGAAGTVARLSAALRAGLEPLRERRGVLDVRVLGAVGVVRVDRPVEGALHEAVTAAALDAGVWLRPFRDLVYAMPPYACTDADIEVLTAGVAAAVDVAVG